MTKVTIDRELLERLATECEAETEWNCANVPAGTRAATTRAIAMKSVADELRTILAAPRQPEGDGLEVVGWYHSHAEVTTSDKARVVQWLPECVEPLCRLSDAQRAIAELRDRLDVMNQCADNYSRIFEEYDRLRNCLLEVTVRHSSESLKRRSSGKELEQYLSDGIAQLEAERDTLRQQRNKLAGLLAKAQEALHPHDNAVLWGEICTVLAEVKPCPESHQPAAT